MPIEVVLYSFDVFDTLITRKTPAPQGVFDIIQYNLLHPSTDYNYELPRSILENYANIRIAAEKLVRENYNKQGIEEITLDDIYDVFHLKYGIDNDTLDFLKKIEIQTEWDLSIPILRNVLLVRKLLERDKRVVLISDMYLSQDDIRKMLLKANDCFQNVPLYVSSEYRMTKRDETLFHLVHDKEYVDFSMWHHMGDNEKADIQIPKRLGIRTTYFHREKLWHSERIFLDLNYLNPSIQYAIGLAKNLRIAHRNASYEWMFGCTIGGYIALSYSLWILNQCMQLKISRLYFIARDGYIPKMITDMLIEKWKLPIETKYIFGSRRAWRMASFTGEKGSIKRLVQFSMADRIRSVKDLAKLLQVSEDCVRSYLPMKLGEKTQWSFYDLHLCIKHLEEDKTFRRDIVAHHASLCHEVCEYLLQEIDVHDDAFAFVEVGGTGYTQECLAKLMQKFYKKDVHTFAVHIGRPGLGKHCIFHNFHKGRYEIILEPLFRALHGQTISYRLCKDRMVPVLDKEDRYLLSYGYEDYIRGLKSFCRHAIAMGWDKNFLTKGDTIYQFIQILINDLKNSEMDFVKNMPFSISDDEMKLFAPRLTKTQIRKIYLSSNLSRIHELYSGSHFPYSLLCCDENLKKRIIFYRRNSKLLRERYWKIYKNKERCDLLERENGIPDFVGLNIVLYGAGKLGKILYRELSEDKGIKSLVWLDANYTHWRDLGYEVVGDIGLLGGLTYDKLIIGMADPDDMVRREMITHGVPREKIIDFL